MASKGHFLTQIPQPVSKQNVRTRSYSQEGTKATLRNRRQQEQKQTTRKRARQQPRDTHQVVQQVHLPIQSGSEIKASLLLGVTSIQSLPSFTTGQDFLHSWLHFLGLHFSGVTIAIRVKASSSLSLDLPAFFLGGIVQVFVSLLPLGSTNYPIVWRTFERDNRTPSVDTSLSQRSSGIVGDRSRFGKRLTRASRKKNEKAAAQGRKVCPSSGLPTFFGIIIIYLAIFELRTVQLPDECF